MRYVLIFLLAIPTGLCRANDTLTRAQVYNFSVGDTFEYLVTEQNNLSVSPCPSYKVSSFGQIITDVYYSAASDTMFIVKESYGQLYLCMGYYNSIVPNAVDFFSETLVITNLSDYEIYYYDYEDGDISYILNDALNGKRVNGAVSIRLGLLSEDMFGEGLGAVRLFQSSGDGYQGWETTVELKYYSKGNETWGNRLNVGIGEPQNLFATVYPTVNSGTFNILTNYLKPTEFQLIDVYGRVVFATELQNQSSDISINEFTPGLFIWRLTESNKLLQTGKLILNR